METASIYEAMTTRRKVKQNQRAWKYIWDMYSQTVGDLNKTAIIDGSKEYTYGLMFREWERYASVFSALGMTEQQHARVGVMGSACVETIFAFYGLNMVGAEVSMVPSWSAFNSARIRETIIEEKLTDFIITDDLAQQDLVRNLLFRRKELGLRHVIILHVPIAGPTVVPMMTAGQEAKRVSMKAIFQPICMETLLKAYGSHPVHYASQEPGETAFILHATGTESGVGKPVPMSDSAFNAAVARFMKMKNLSLPYDQLVTSIMLDLSSSFSIIDQVHLPFAMGATVTVIPFGLLNPRFYEAVPAYRISFLFSVSSMIDRWMKLPGNTKFDFSSLKFVALGGTAVSAAEKKRYREFFEAHGGRDVTILSGYGLSELGGACCLSTPDQDDESIGYPLPGIDIRLCDDETGRFFAPRGKACEGVLYLNAQSMASPDLDGKEIFKVEIIDRKPYVCTNDLVRVDEDGRITCLSPSGEEGPTDLVQQVIDDITADFKNNMPMNKFIGRVRKASADMGNGSETPFGNVNAANPMQGMRPDVPVMVRKMARAVLSLFQQQTSQMLSNINRMNRMAFEMTGRFCEHQGEMAGKWFEMAGKMAGTKSAEAEEAVYVEAGYVETEVVETEAVE